MNGHRKYEVTIRGFNHPAVTSSSDTGRYSQTNDMVEQKNTRESNLNVSEVKSVYESSVSLQLAQKRNGNRVHDSARCRPPKDWDDNSHDSKLKAVDKLGEKGMPSSSCCSEACKKALTHKTASLNIYKLTTTNNAAIDQGCFELGEGSFDVNCIEAWESLKPVRYITTETFHTTQSANIETKYDGGYKPKNGFKRQLPTVVLNSTNMEEASRQIVLGDKSIENGADGFLPDICETRTRRPPLNREGSACSNDSIITEIEALSEEESDLKPCSNQGDGSNCEENAQKTNDNWKKIRGMLHWAPFAKHYKKKYPWVQLAGHQGNFKAGEQGTILKKTNCIEKDCLKKLMKDVLRPFVPEFRREIINHEESYLVLQDLLFGFESPSVMDCKMGVRTFLEDELEQARKQPTSRKDLYQKMIDIDPNAPTEDERRIGGISKPRYMKWREELSSSASLGFRIEGIKKADDKPNKDFKTTRSREELCEKFRNFINDDPSIKVKYIQRLKAIRGVLESSSFFQVHEVIGSSLLFVHDYHGNVNVWMIDFAKTTQVKDGIQLTHRDQWHEGNHEDGYLFGLDNMISIWSNV